MNDLEKNVMLFVEQKNLISVNLFFKISGNDLKKKINIKEFFLKNQC